MIDKKDETLITENPRSKITLNNNKVTKFYFGSDKFSRYKTEAGFYQSTKLSCIPFFHSAEVDDQIPLIKMSFLGERYPGFISDEETKNLSPKDFEDIRTTLSYLLDSEIQVHGDFAPHNIYLNKNNERTVMLVDWEDSFKTLDRSYLMYDYATLWSYLYIDDDKFVHTFKNFELPAMRKDGLLDSFLLNYKRKLMTLLEHEKWRNRGPKLHDFILSL